MTAGLGAPSTSQGIAMDTVHGVSGVMMVGAYLHRLNPLVRKQLALVRGLPETAPSRPTELAYLTDLFMTCPDGLMVLPYGCTAQAWEGLKSDGWELVFTLDQDESSSLSTKVESQSSTKPAPTKPAASQSTLAQAQDRATSLPFGEPGWRKTWHPGLGRWCWVPVTPP